MTTLNLIGAGHVGRTLGRLFAAQGDLTVQDVLTRSAASAEEAVGFIGAGRAVGDPALLRPADIVMLAVGDDQIEAVCESLKVAAGTVVFHCSGAKSSSVLAAARAQGAFTASVHPVRSFADPARVAGDFAGTWCGVEGDADALAVLTPILKGIGAQLVAIDPRAKTVYHAASVFASNYLVTLMDAALSAYQAAGIPEQVARELARPLALETLDNVLRLGPRQALSGPIARGDLATVARQQQALDEWDGGVGALYRALAEATVTLARNKWR